MRRAGVALAPPPAGASRQLPHRRLLHFSLRAWVESQEPNDSTCFSLRLCLIGIMEFGHRCSQINVFHLLTKCDPPVPVSKAPRGRLKRLVTGQPGHRAAWSAGLPGGCLGWVSGWKGAGTMALGERRLRPRAWPCPSWCPPFLSDHVAEGHRRTRAAWSPACPAPWGWPHPLPVRPPCSAVTGAEVPGTLHDPGNRRRECRRDTVFLSW